MRRVVPFIFILIYVFALAGCGGDKPKGDGTRRDSLSALPIVYDLDSILEHGEIVVATLRNADTYSEFDDTIIGMQYALADSLSRHLAVRLRMVVAPDSASLFRIIHSDSVDVVALWLDSATIDSLPLMSAMPKDTLTGRTWAIRDGAVQLQEALAEWGTQEMCDSVEARLFRMIRQWSTVRKHVQPPFISLEKDILSIYDELFKSAARTVGWDWHLVAALAYEESGFDPNAVSGAGARGLMQVMERTAAEYGVSDFLEPRQNVSVAALHLRRLVEDFSDIRDKNERVKFVLAAYNGGAGHVRDAMALCRRDGGNPLSWQAVSPYLLMLSRPAAYRDPIVRYGLVIGEETVMYVIKVMRRWEQYIGHLPTAIPTFPGAASATDSLRTSIVTPEERAAASRPHAAPRAAQRNRFTIGTQILGPNDPRLLHVEGDTASH